MRILDLKFEKLKMENSIENSFVKVSHALKVGLGSTWKGVDW